MSFVSFATPKDQLIELARFVSSIKYGQEDSAFLQEFLNLQEGQNLLKPSQKLIDVVSSEITKIQERGIDWFFFFSLSSSVETKKNII